MLLRNEESVETPEGRLNETIRRHLREPEANLSRFSSEKKDEISVSEFQSVLLRQEPRRQKE